MTRIDDKQLKTLRLLANMPYRHGETPIIGREGILDLLAHIKHPRS